MNKKGFCFFVISALAAGLCQGGIILWYAPILASLGFVPAFIFLSKKPRFLFALTWAMISTSVSVAWLLSFKYLGPLSFLLYICISLLLAFPQAFVFYYVARKNNGSLYTCFRCAAIGTLSEWLRLFIFCGFGFHFSGLALCSSTLSMQVASIAGVLGLSFCVWLANLLFFKWIQTDHKRVDFLYWVLGAAAPYIIGYVILVVYLRAEQKCEVSKVMLVQTGTYPSQKSKMKGFENEYVPKLEQIRSILKLVLQQDQRGIELIVLPEVSLSGEVSNCIYPVMFLDAVADLLPKEYFAHMPPLIAPYCEVVGGKVFVSNAFFFQLMANLSQSQIIVGLDYEEKSSAEYGNAAISFYPHVDEQKKYCKKMLVPFAEYCPLELLKKLIAAHGIHSFYSPGDLSNLIQGKRDYGIMMCIEELSTELAREVKNAGAQLFVTLGNDGWFPGTMLPWHHFFAARLRAVENGIPMIRACSTGITSVISAAGENLAFLPFNSKEKSVVSGALIHEIKMSERRTLYSIWGDSFIIYLAFFILLARNILGKRSN